MSIYAESNFSKEGFFFCAGIDFFGRLGYNRKNGENIDIIFPTNLLTNPEERAII